jgi:chromate reductase
MKISVISTSPRKASASLRAARYIANTLQSKGFTEVSVLDFEDCDIPLVGRGDLDPHSLSAFQQHLIGNWAASDLLIFTAPEYNWTTGGEFINAIHQLGDTPFAHLFHNKTFAFVGVSTGRGGRQPCLELNMIMSKIISFLNKQSIVSPKIMESHETKKNVDEAGNSTGNEAYEKTVDNFVTYLTEMAARWKAGA